MAHRAEFEFASFTDFTYNEIKVLEAKTMFIHPQQPKRILPWLIFALIAGVLTIAIILFSPSQAPASPTITWTPSSITETFLPGESQTLSVSFTTSEDVSDVAARVVPELVPYVRTDPTSFAQVTKGQAMNLSIIVSVAQTAPLGTVDGTIQLRSASDPKKSFAQPLPVTVSIVEPLTEPLLGELVIQPLTITAETPTIVFAEVFIADPGLIPQSVRLDRLDGSGRVIATLSNLRDDGQGGDLKAGDKRFSQEFTFDEPSTAFIRLRASAAFTGILQRAVSTEQGIRILEPVADTGPEELIQTVTATLLSTQDVNELEPFFDETAFATLKESVAHGVPLEIYGRVFQTARLESKTANSARFTAFVARGGELFGGTITLEKFPEGWKIVGF